MLPRSIGRNCANCVAHADRGMGAPERRLGTLATSERLTESCAKYSRAVLSGAAEHALTAGSRCMAVKCVARRSIAIPVIAPEKDCKILASWVSIKVSMTRPKASRSEAPGAKVRRPYFAWEKSTFPYEDCLSSGSDCKTSIPGSNPGGASIRLRSIPGTWVTVRSGDSARVELQSVRVDKSRRRSCSNRSA